MERFTRLSILCKIFGWNGGTIHQVNTEAQNVVEDHSINVLNMPEAEFQALCEDLKALYPSYKQFRSEGHN